MGNFEGIDRSRESKWLPEEEKNWPLYLRERFLLFNYVQSLNFQEIIKTLEKNPNLISLDLFNLLVSVVKQSKGMNSIPVELIDKFVSLASTKNIIDRIRLIEICGEIGEPAIKILRLIMGDDNDVGSLVKLVEVFVRLRDNETAWEIFNKIETKGTKFSVLEAAYILAETNTEKIYQIIERFRNDNDYFVRLKVVRCLIKIGRIDEAINILENLEYDENLALKLSVIEILYEISTKGLRLEAVEELKTNLIEGLKNSDDLWERLNLAEKLIKLNNEEINLVFEILNTVMQRLDEVSEEENEFYCEEIIDIVEVIGISALKILSLIKNNKSENVRIKIARALAKMGRVGLEMLEEMKNDQSREVVKEVEAAIFQNEILERLKDQREKDSLIRSLILRQEPILANPFIMMFFNEDDKNLILKLNDIIADLRNKYPNLIGLSVLGSLSKGYWTSTSDIDWGLIVDGDISEELIKSFKEKCEEVGFRLCDFDNNLNVANLEGQYLGNLQIAFNGLFIGDRKRLKEIQRKIINYVSQEGWDFIRDVYNENQANIHKMMERFNFSQEEYDFVVSARKFLWSLPDHKIAKIALA